MTADGNMGTSHRYQTPIRILLVDDNLDFLKSATAFLALDTDLQLQVVGWALSGAEALEQVKRLHPDLVLMDLAMPGMSGLEATKLIKTDKNAPRIIILTLVSNTEYDLAAHEVHADGCLAKSDIGTHLHTMIHNILKPLEGEG